MIEHAYVSGPLGRAIVLEKECAWLLFADNPTEKVACGGRDFSIFLDSGAEFFEVLGDNLSFDDVGGTLAESSHAADTLVRMIAAMDTNFSLETRTLSIKVAEDLLTDDVSRKFVRSRLLGIVKPEKSDVEDALVLAEKTGSRLACEIYRDMVAYENATCAVAEAWKELSLEEGETREAHGDRWIDMVDLGVITGLVEAVATKDLKTVQSSVLLLSVNPTVSARIPRIAHVLTALLGVLAKRLTQIEGVASEPLQEHETAPPFDPIAEMISTAAVAQTIDHSVRKGGEDTREAVQKQIEWISQEICKGQYQRVMNDLEVLVRLQLDRSTFEDLAKTLCSLANTASIAGQQGLAREIVDYAGLLNIEDPVIWSTRAEIARRSYTLSDALEIYEQAIRIFENNAIVRNGRAEVLKEMGRLDEALEAYEATLKDFPNNVSARNGRAEMLKEMGRLDEALEAYEATLKDFPNDAIVRNGLATVLMLKGEYFEARSLLLNIELSSRGDWIAEHIKAMSFMKEGKYAEAERAFENGLNKTPFLSCRKYFATALAICQIQSHKTKDACEILSFEFYFQRRKERLVRSALMSHILAEEGDLIQAHRELEKIAGVVSLPLSRLKRNLDARYGLSPGDLPDLSEENMQVLNANILSDEILLAVA